MDEYLEEILCEHLSMSGDIPGHMHSGAFNGISRVILEKISGVLPDEKPEQTSKGISGSFLN